MASAAPFSQPAHAEVLALLSEFSRFGATGTGGVSRLACDQADGLARAHLVDWLKSNEFDVQIDEIGNIFGLWDFGTGDQDLMFLCGSHLDSQPNGGKFDGALGVVTALVVAKSVKAAVLEGNLEPMYGSFAVVAWTSEEGARFQPSLLGSSVFTQKLALQDALQTEDKDGITVEQALSKIGYAGTDVIPMPNYYFELHIEQGTKLESANNSIGIVEASWGATKLLVTIHGRADHTGPTPMAARKDALLAASQLVLAVNELSKNTSSNLHTSVGRMEIAPNSPNTIAETVRMWVELRSDDQNALSVAAAQLNETINELPALLGCVIKIDAEEHRTVTHFDSVGCDIVDAAASTAGLRTARMSTVAGHDAINLQNICPSSLIFVPSKDGISHSPDEFTSDEDILAGYEASLASISSLLVTPVSQANSGARNEH
jgi:N-carbamoyl-L-amino-acid hydrolase